MWIFSDVALVGGIERSTPMLFHQAPSRARRRVRSGDILVSTVRTYLKAIAAVRDAPDNLIASTGFCVIRPKDVLDADYAGWAAKSEEFVGEVVSRSVGVSYPAINASQLVDIRIPLPAIGTQRRIATFLNQKSAQIDGLIAKKQALLDRLAEKRQALITHAVTQGLDPAAPMKDSGIHWLGQIPAHWEIRPLRWFIRIRSGDGLTSEQMSAEESPEYVVPVIGGNGIMGYTNKCNSEGVTLVIGRVGALCGNVHKVSGEAWITDNALAVSSVRDFDSAYLVYQLRLLDLNTLATVNAQPLMTGATVKAQRLACPPASEQKSIVNWLDAKSATLLIAEDQIMKSLRVLNEYRSALITAAVTGQIEELR